MVNDAGLADNPDVESGVVGHDDVLADEGHEVEVAVPPAWLASHVGLGDPVDRGVEPGKSGDLGRRTHQPVPLVDDAAVSDLDQADRAGRSPEVVGGLEIQRGVGECHRSSALAHDPARGVVAHHLEHARSQCRRRRIARRRGLARTSRWVEAQAAIVSNRNRRLAVAREMYAMRFPGESVIGTTMQQLRGREGARVRRAYRDAADLHGVEWGRRSYDSLDLSSGDPVNQALSATTACLYGLVHAVVVSLGCSPGLGIVHTGHERSFVFDVADLYKADLAIPVAFEVAASGTDDVPGDARRAMRDAFHEQQLLQRCVRDVQTLLAEGDSSQVENWDVIYLWDGASGRVAGGRDYTEEVEVPW